MKDEIKEINIKMPGQILDYVDTKEHLLELFNHINNLQEEVNKLTAESTEWESKCYDLQEELKEYKMIFDAFSERPYAHRYLEEKKKELGNDKIIGLDSEMIYKDYYDLKEENERYKRIFEGKERFSKIMPDDTDFIILSKADYDRQQEDIELGLIDYKSRNEQAIRYIERCRDYHRDIHKEERIFPDEITSLLMILNGGDEE